MHKNKMLFLDFDETMFDHYGMLTWIDNLLAGQGVIEKGSLIDSADDYHTQITDILRLYQHDKHYLEVTGNPWSYISGQIHSELRRSNVDFCYPETHDFLSLCTDLNSYETRILSFGNGDYQRFKMNTCPVIRQTFIPIHITDEPKSEYLSRHIPADVSGILIDDKYPLNLPSNIKHILIDRKHKYENVSDVSVIDNLNQALDILG